MDKEMESLPAILSNGMRIDRTWEMPNPYTFAMQAVKKLLAEEMTGPLWVDPFCGQFSPASLRNDANQDFKANAHMDGLEWLRSLPSNSADGVLFDPPYSVEQALRCYKPKHNGTAGREEYHARCMDELARITKLGGKAIRFAWTSSGLGMGRSFHLQRILLICHGAAHNDTIVTVESKLQAGFDFWQQG